MSQKSFMAAMENAFGTMIVSMSGRVTDGYSLTSVAFGREP
jgi:hypothetical protein